MIYIYRNMKNHLGFAIVASDLRGALELIKELKFKLDDLEFVGLAKTGEYLAKERKFQA